MIKLRHYLRIGVACALLHLSAAEAAAAIFTSRSEHHGSDGLVVLGARYLVLTGDPQSFNIVCFDVIGDLGDFVRFRVDGLERSNGACAFAGFGGLSVSYVSVYGPGAHLITIIAREPTTGAEVARISFQVNNVPPAPIRSLRIRAGLNAQSPEPATGVTLPTTARVPLGAFVRFQTTDNQDEPLPSAFTLGTAAVDPGVEATALFPQDVLLEYSGPPGHYQAVHKGTVTITIAPNDAAVPAGSVTVVVEDPRALGAPVPFLDPMLYVLGHRTGIPPQFIKAHAHKESGARFNPLAYRYEPIGGYVGDLASVSRGRNLRTLSPYRDYRLATQLDSVDGILAQGALMTSADRDVRAGLLIDCDQAGRGGRAIVPTDALVTVWEIFRCNDTRMRWRRWAGRAGAERARAIQRDAFTAQTHLAASFGLLQMTYVTAIQQMNWSGAAGGAKNPSLLIDSQENWDQGAGSLIVGTAKVLADYRLVNSRVVSGMVRVGSPVSFLRSFVPAWDQYNPGEGGYGSSLMLLVDRYLPEPVAPALGGGQ